MQSVEHSRLLASALVAIGSLINMPANAADIPIKAPAAAYAWTGFYVGGHAGFGIANNNVDVGFLPDPVFFGALPLSVKADTKGPLGGIQAGHNWTIGAFVVGAEADISLADVSGSGVTPVIHPTQGFQGLFFQAHQRMDWFGTARLRLGTTPAERLLVYLTGGLAFGHIDYRAHDTNPTIEAHIDTQRSSTRAGWTVGGGVEWVLARNWTVKAEYLYYDLGDLTFITDAAPPNPPFQARIALEERGHVVRAGLNYKFGGPADAR
jgi:outer membrane immunogenic protein